MFVLVEIFMGLAALLVVITSLVVGTLAVGEGVRNYDGIESFSFIFMGLMEMLMGIFLTAAYIYFITSM